MPHADDIATGRTGPKRLQIRGRPAPGKTDVLIFLEEPGEPIQTHFRSRREPHWKRDCPHCLPDPRQNETTPMWYVGGMTLRSELVIVELTEKCYEAAMSGARERPLHSGISLFGEPLDEGGKLHGLYVEISRQDFDASPRVLRAMKRVVTELPEWPFRTREELARVWGIPIKPRVWRKEA